MTRRLEVRAEWLFALGVAVLGLWVWKTTGSLFWPLPLALLAYVVEYGPQRRDRRRWLLANFLLPAAVWQAQRSS